MRTIDTFNYFISQSFFNLKDKLYFSFIVPNNLLYQSEYYKTRKFLLNKYIKRIINLVEHIFELAEVPTCIFIIQNMKLKNYSFDFLDLRNHKTKTDFSYFDNIEMQNILENENLIFGILEQDNKIIKKVYRKIL